MEQMIKIIQNSVGGCAEHWARLIAEALYGAGYRKNRTEQARKAKRYELNNLIAEKGYNAIELAKILGYTQSVVYSWINGWRKPRKRDMKRLAEVLGVPFERIERIFEEKK
jgi:transcriptional regulator with XRE-family HTH domain